jgi:hypothetical protein
MLQNSSKVIWEVLRNSAPCECWKEVYIHTFVLHLLGPKLTHTCAMKESLKENTPF